VISRAGSDAASVVGLVFVAAFAPDEGESLLEIIGRYADVPLGAALRPAAFTIDGVDTPGTEFFIDGASFHDAFCADLPADQALVMSVSQRPAAVEAFATPLVGTPAWRTLPSWFVVANDDHAIHPDSQRFMAERAGSGVTAIDASHAVAVAQPAAVAAVIRKALS
jgi:pimeloyl-ACP methyl ester carboxylesterase